MKTIRRLLPALALITLCDLVTPSFVRAAEHDHVPAAGPKGSLVMFVTQDDPIIAGHALHFAEHALGDGHRVTIILVGNAAKFALKAPDLPKSPVTGNGLDHKLRELVAKQAKVNLTPFSMAALGAKIDDLAPGVAPACEPALHAHMFEPATKLMVW